MKPDFFYDKEDKKPYQQEEDWYKEIKHLIIPCLIFMAMAIGFLAYISFT